MDMNIYTYVCMYQYLYFYMYIWTYIHIDRQTVEILVLIVRNLLLHVYTKAN